MQAAFAEPYVGMIAVSNKRLIFTSSIVSLLLRQFHEFWQSLNPITEHLPIRKCMVPTLLINCLELLIVSSHASSKLEASRIVVQHFKSSFFDSVDRNIFAILLTFKQVVIIINLFLQ